MIVIITCTAPTFINSIDSHPGFTPSLNLILGVPWKNIDSYHSSGSTESSRKLNIKLSSLIRKWCQSKESNTVFVFFKVSKYI